jgi:hypothetical protein
MNQRNVEALYGILWYRFPVSDVNAAMCRWLAEELAGEGVLAVDSIDDDAALTILGESRDNPVRFEESDPTHADVFRAALNRYAKGEQP